MDKSLIMNNYAIDQGYESWEDLYIQSDMIFRHFHNVIDLIQEELRKKIHNELNGVNFYNRTYFEHCRKEILNTEIL